MLISSIEALLNLGRRAKLLGVALGVVNVEDCPQSHGPSLIDQLPTLDVVANVVRVLESGGEVDLDSGYGHPVDLNDGVLNNTSHRIGDGVLSLVDS